MRPAAEQPRFCPIERRVQAEQFGTLSREARFGAGGDPRSRSQSRSQRASWRKEARVVCLVLYKESMFLPTRVRDPNPG